MVEYLRRIIHGTEQHYNSSGLSGNYPPIAVDKSGHLLVDVEAEVSSGLHVWVSGQHVYVESGANVTASVSSGLHVWVSGQHVYVESGANVTAQINSGAFIDGVSGTHVYVESGTREVAAILCSQEIRTGGLVKITGGSSGTYLVGSSGGQSICVSGQWCSGLVHVVTVKNMDGNEDIFIGGSGCKPYSGFGYVLGGNEEVTLDVCNPCVIWACANISGEMLTWIGTNY